MNDDPLEQRQEPSPRRSKRTEVIGEFPGAWGGRTLLFAQESESGAYRLLCPGVDVGDFGGTTKPYAWRLIRSEDGGLTARELSLHEVMELLPPEWEKWAVRAHREVIAVLEDYLRDRDQDATLQDGLLSLRAELRELEDAPVPEAGTVVSVRLIIEARSHEFELAASGQDPALGTYEEPGPVGFSIVTEERDPGRGERRTVAELDVRVWTDAISISRSDDRTDPIVLADGNEVSSGPGGRKRFRLEPAESDLPVRRGRTLVETLRQIITISE